MGGQGGRSCANVRWPCCEKARVMLALPELNRLQRIIRIMLNDLSFNIKVLAFLLPLRLYSCCVLVRFPASFALEP